MKKGNVSLYFAIEEVISSRCFTKAVFLSLVNYFIMEFSCGKLTFFLWNFSLPLKSMNYSLPDSKEWSRVDKLYLDAFNLV